MDQVRGSVSQGILFGAQWIEDSLQAARDFHEKTPMTFQPLGFLFFRFVCFLKLSSASDWVLRLVGCLSIRDEQHSVFQFPAILRSRSNSQINRFSIKQELS